MEQLFSIKGKVFQVEDFNFCGNKYRKNKTENNNLKFWKQSERKNIKTTTTTARRSVIPMSNLLATFLPFYMDLYFVSTKLIQKNYVIRSTSRCKIKTNHDLVSRGFHAPRGVRLCFDSGSFIIVFPNCYVWSTLKISDWPYRVRTRRVGTNFKLRGTMDSTAPGV